MSVRSGAAPDAEVVAGRDVDTEEENVWVGRGVADDEYEDD